VEPQWRGVGSVMEGDDPKDKRRMGEEAEGKG